jgi:hypothetical protein
MSLGIFDHKLHPPKPEELPEVLGKTFALWNELIERVERRFTPVIFEWGFASKTTGWGMRVKTPKRTILYMTPGQGYFLASFALGEKAVKMAHEAKLPSKILKSIDEAKKFAEGRGVRLEVRNAGDVRNIEKLATIKMAS